MNAISVLQKCLHEALSGMRVGGSEVFGNPDLENFGIQRITDPVSGMTACEIIKYANANSTVKIEVQTKP